MGAAPGGFWTEEAVQAHEAHWPGPGGPGGRRARGQAHRSSCASTTSAIWEVGRGDRRRPAVRRASWSWSVRTSVSKGKGDFLGVMKRHGFGGLGASHGTPPSGARAPGSIGGGGHPLPRVFQGYPGWRVASGGQTTTTLNLTVVGGRRRAATCCWSRAPFPGRQGSRRPGPGRSRSQRQGRGALGVEAQRRR